MTIILGSSHTPTLPLLQGGRVHLRFYGSWAYARVYGANDQKSRQDMYIYIYLCIFTASNYMHASGCIFLRFVSVMIVE